MWGSDNGDQQAWQHNDETGQRLRLRNNTNFLNSIWFTQTSFTPKIYDSHGCEHLQSCVSTSENKLKSDTDTARATFLRHRSLDIIETPPAKSTKRQMPSVFSDKNGALMTTSPTTMHTESLKTKKEKRKKKKHSRPHCPQVSHFFSER